MEQKTRRNESMSILPNQSRILCLTPRQKVFCIGLNKTGTKSFAKAMRILGYRTSKWDARVFSMYENSDEAGLNAVLSEYDSFHDWPWPLMTRSLMAQFPYSKFVLTKRKSAEIWLASIEKHSRRTPDGQRLRKKIFGYANPQGHERAYLSFYESFNNSIADDFESAGRKTDLMEVCWETGAGWQELCLFLNEPVPLLSFPHENNSMRFTNQVEKEAGRSLPRFRTDDVMGFDKRNFNRR
jgi:hypothetical protein